MQVIQHQELASSQASITFSSIPQTYTDLCLVLSLRSNRASQNDYAGVQPNGLTANQSLRLLFGTGSSAGSDAGTARIYAIVNGDSATASTFSNSSVYFTNYTASSAKSVSVDSTNETNATGVLMGIAAGLWNDTAAITSLTIVPISGGTTWLQYSSATLYGITKGSNGIVTVS
jgi:hypothetical protein